MKYIHSERDYISIEIHATINGYTIFAVNHNTINMVPVTQGIATMLNAMLPEDYHPHHSSLSAAQKDLERLAKVNGWAEVTDL